MLISATDGQTHVSQAYVTPVLPSSDQSNEYTEWEITE